MTTTLHVATLLEHKVALALLHAAGLAPDGRGSVRAACLHRVLMLEVGHAQSGPYRGAATSEVRVLVDAVEPVRSVYLAHFDPAQIAWREDTPSPSDQARIDARITRVWLDGMRLRRWAVAEVAEIAWDAPKAAWEGLIGIGSERHRIDLVDTQPVRWLQRDATFTTRAQQASSAGWVLAGVSGLAGPYLATISASCVPAVWPLLGVGAAVALTTTLVSEWLARRVPARMRPASPLPTRADANAATSHSARAA
jgi:hypothetical protein